MTAQTVVLPWPRPLTQNETRRLHHYSEAAQKTQLKMQARAVIRATQLTPTTGPVAVILTHRPADRRRRDTDGPAPALKTVLDALVDEGILPDDNSMYVPKVMYHYLQPVPGEPAATWVTIAPADWVTIAPPPKEDT